MMKKFYLLIVISLSISAKAQFNEVLTLADNNQMTESASYYEDHLFQGKYYYISPSANLQKAYLNSFDPATNTLTQVKEVTSNYQLTATGYASTNAFQYHTTDNILYFVTGTIMGSSGAEMELWRTDGTSNGTVKLLSYQTGANDIVINHSLVKSRKSDLVLNGEMVFICNPTPNSKQIWKTDGTVAGTVMIKSFTSTGTLYQTSIILGKSGNNIIFTNLNNYQWELWKTDGTTAGTVPIQNGGNTVTMNNDLGFMNGRFYYVKSTNILDPNATTVYSTDGNTVQTHPLVPGVPMYAEYMRDNNEGIYYLDNNSSIQKHSLYFTDSNTANAHLLADFPAGNKYEFVWSNNTGVLLNKYSGSTVIAQVYVDKSGQQRLMPNPLKFSSNADEIIEFKNTIYIGSELINDTPKYGKEMWRMDTDNCLLAQDIAPGVTTYGSSTYTNHSSPQSFFVLNNKMYFIGTNSSYERKLYSFNGDFTFNNSTGNNLWSAGNNWNSSMAPMLTDNAAIPAGFSPTVDANAFAKNLSVNSPLSISGGNLHISGTLDLGAKVTLNNNDLVLKGGNSQITNGNSANYILTNGTGTVNVENLNVARGTVNIPIGTVANYNPVSISNAGTSDTFSARVSDGISNTTNAAVNATWEISEGTAGGSNLSLSLGWNQSQENPSFARTAAKVGHYQNGSWIEENSGTVSGTNPYTISASGISSFSPFSVMNFAALATVDLQKKDISVYPNPFSDNLNILMTENGMVNFYDLSGKLVSTEFLRKGINALEKSSLVKGTYVYEIINSRNERVSSGKIIKN